MAAIEQAQNKLTLPWRSALVFLGGVRRWVLIPNLLLALPQIVLALGGLLESHASASPRIGIVWLSSKLLGFAAYSFY